MKLQELRQIIREEIQNSLQEENPQLEKFDRMDSLANSPDLKILSTKLRMLTHEWMSEGFDKEDVKEFINNLIDGI